MLDDAVQLPATLAPPSRIFKDFCGLWPSPLANPHFWALSARVSRFTEQLCYTLSYLITILEQKKKQTRDNRGGGGYKGGKAAKRNTVRTYMRMHTVRQFVYCRGATALVA